MQATAVAKLRKSRCVRISTFVVLKPAEFRRHEVQLGKVSHNNEKGVGLFLHQQGSIGRLREREKDAEVGNRPVEGRQISRQQPQAGRAPARAALGWAPRLLNGFAGLSPN